MPGALSSPSSPSAEPLSGLAIGLGFLATAIVLLFLPRLLRLNAPWPTASRVSAWVLLTIGVAGTGTELEKLRPGFANLGVGLLLLSVAAGMLALATRVLHGRISCARPRRQRVPGTQHSGRRSRGARNNQRRAGFPSRRLRRPPGEGASAVGGPRGCLSTRNAT